MAGKKGIPSNFPSFPPRYQHKRGNHKIILLKMASLPSGYLADCFLHRSPSVSIMLTVTDPSSLLLICDREVELSFACLAYMYRERFGDNLVLTSLL